MAMQTGSNGNGLPPPLAEINVTPLVDVMLVLLIIFMVSAPLLDTDEGVEVALPETERSSDLPVDSLKPLVVTVDAKGDIYLSNAETKVPVERLEGAVAGILGDEPGKEVFLKADREVRYGVVVDVMARLKSAGVADLGMVTIKPEEGR